MKKFIAALAGLAILSVSAPAVAGLPPVEAWIPHGTLACSSFTPRLAHDCIHIKADGAHWQHFDNNSAWRLIGRADTLYRYQHHDALKPNVG